MPAVFRTTRVVEFGDTDMAGIVHFANFFRFMEAAEHAFLRSLGLSVVMEIDGGKYGLPRVSASCDYLKPARFGDELTDRGRGRQGRPQLRHTTPLNSPATANRSRAAGSRRSFCRFDRGRPQAWELPSEFRREAGNPASGRREPAGVV